MKTFIQSGKSLTLTAPYNRLSGEGALVGGIFGVAAVDVTSGDDAAFDLVGVFSLAKVGSQAWSVGDLIYWDNSSKYCTKTVGSNKAIGYCTEDVGSGAGETLGQVLLIPGVDSDPGNMAQAAVVAALTGSLTGTTDGAITDVAAIALSTSNTYSDSAVNTAVNTAITSINLQHKELQTTVNAILTALKNAGLMASS